MFKLKEGVNPKGIQYETIEAIIRTAAVYKLLGAELVVTSISDGKHKKGSKHYIGNAFDCRVWDFPIGSEKREQLLTMLEEVLNYAVHEYDIIDENDHIHIEYDPKVGVDF